jgi:hypothetical protein
MSALLTSACGEKTPPQAEFLSYLCEAKSNKCGTPEVYRFKVRAYENKVLLNIFSLDGKAEGNEFLSNCQIINSQNWNCKEMAMVEGQLVVARTNENSPANYLRIEKK